MLKEVTESLIDQGHEEDYATLRKKVDHAVYNYFRLVNKMNRDNRFPVIYMSYLGNIIPGLKRLERFYSAKGRRYYKDFDGYSGDYIVSRKYKERAYLARVVAEQIRFYKEILHNPRFTRDKKSIREKRKRSKLLFLKRMKAGKDRRKQILAERKVIQESHYKELLDKFYGRIK